MLRRNSIIKTVPTLVFLFLLVGSLTAFDFSEIKNKITSFTLDNGMTFVVMEDHSAPVVSFALQADVGGADDPKEYTGLAHVFEHMAFKGTTEIGTKNWKKEKTCLEELDDLFYQIKREERKGNMANEEILSDLRDRFKKQQEECDQYVVDNEFPNIVEREGGVGLNAGTGYDNTTYFISLPSNKAELWFTLESSRFSEPVLRQFYKELEVIKEERRMTRESSSQGRLIEEFLNAAYKAHPYGVPLIGHMSDINNMDKDAAMAFYHRYYVPSNLVAGIVGDVDPQEIKKLAEEYFGKISNAPKPGQPVTIEPEQKAEKRIIMEDKSQPILIMSFHRPDGGDPDDAAFATAADYLGQGRTSLLYESLVKEKKIATQVAAFESFPGNKYPTLFGIYVIPAKGFTAEECEAEVLAIIDKLKEESISEEELVKVKARAKSQLINGLSSRQGLAYQLAAFQTRYGDWNVLFDSLDDINAVTVDDVKRVVNQYFTHNNLTVGYIKTVDEG